MAATLLATQVPIPTLRTTLDLLSTAQNAAGSSGASVLKKVVQGATTFAAYWNRNALSIELIGRWSCGTFCVINGLTLGTGSGLALAVAAGQAMMSGVVEVPTATTYTVPANQARVFIWLQQDGTLTHTLTTTPPAGTVCFIGSCVTGASSISSVDTSGILYSLGPIAQRETADTGTPGDAPAAGLAFLTKTTNGVYLWNGVAYQLMYTTAQYTELIQDTVGAMVTTSTGVAWTYNDTAGTLAMNFTLSAFTTDQLPQGTEMIYVQDTTRKQFSYPATTASITADRTLNVTTSHNIQGITASGANRSVLLPSASGLGFGNWFRIMNIGPSNSVIVKDVSGVALLTLTTAQYTDIIPVPSTGVPAWPATISATSMSSPL